MTAPAAIWVVPQASRAVLGEGLGWRWEETDLEQQRGPHTRIRGYLVWRPTSGTIVRVLTLIKLLVVSDILGPTCTGNNNLDESQKHVRKTKPNKSPYYVIPCTGNSRTGKTAMGIGKLPLGVRVY